MQAMIDNGKITEEEAKTHPDRNVITRAIGVVNFVDVDFDVIDLNEGEKLLVCTDGLSGSIESDEMLEIVNANSDFSAEKLVERALVNGSRDNVTVVVMSTEDQGA
jgi:protein phosphatase